MLNICSKWKLKQGIFQGEVFDVISEEEKKFPVLSLKVLKVFEFLLGFLPLVWRKTIEISLFC